MCLEEKRKNIKGLCFLLLCANFCADIIEFTGHTSGDLRYFKTSFVYNYYYKFVREVASTVLAIYVLVSKENLKLYNSEHKF